MSKETYNKLENIFDYFSNSEKDFTFIDTIKDQNSDINVNHYISNNGFNIYKYKDENGINNTIISKRTVNNKFSLNKDKSIDTYFHKKEYEEGFNTISCVIGESGKDNVAKIEYDSRTAWNNTFFVPPLGTQKGIDESPSYLFEKAIDYIGKNDNYKKSVYKDALNTYKDIMNKTSNKDDNLNDSYELILAEEFMEEISEDNEKDAELKLRNELEHKSLDELIEIYNDLKMKIEKNKSYLKSLNYNY